MMIILEGIDNSGKTTIAAMIAEYYEQKGKKTFISKELTTRVGNTIKESIKNEGLSAITKTFLFAADRQIRLEQINSNTTFDVLIMDRYLHSAVVYREAEGLDGDWVKEVNKNIPKSDFAFYIDITPEESIRRNTDTKFNIHYSTDHLTRVRESYLSYVRSEELVLIDGMRDISSVKNDIIKALEEKEHANG